MFIFNFHKNGSVVFYLKFVFLFSEYLQELCELLMYIVLPSEDFQNLVSRLILRVSGFFKK